MNRATAYAEIDFLRNNPQGFRWIEPDQTIPVLLAFAESGMSATDLLLRIAQAPSNKHEALLAVATWFEQQHKRSEFIGALVSLRGRVWDDRLLSVRDIVPLFRTSDLAMLVEMRANILFDRNHPLFGVLNLDAYWMDRIQNRIKIKDFRRAWDEICRAGRGLMIDTVPTMGETPMNLTSDPNNRCYRASDACIEQLVEALYGAMEQDRMLPKQESLDLGIPDRYVQISVYNKRVRRSYDISVHRSALTFALRFQRDATSLTLTGAMIMKIADYFRIKREDRRRARRKAQFARAAAR